MSAFSGALLGSAVGQIVINTGDAEKNINQLGDAIDGLDARTSKFGGAGVIGKGLTAISGAILGGFALAGNAAANFEQRMSAVQSVTNATGTEFDALREKALQLGKDTQFSATEAAMALEELAKAGVSTKDILAGAADGAVALAAAAGTDLPTAATIIANTLNQFQLGGDSATHVADLLAAAANKSATDVTNLGTQLSYAAGEANSLGISADDTVAALAALADQGLNEKSGAGLSQMLVSLVAPTDTAASAIDALGIQVFDSQGKFVGFTSILDQFAAATKGMSDEQKQAALNDIFTTNGARTMIALLQTETDKAKAAGKSWADYQKDVNDAGAASRAAQTRMDNFRGSLEQLRGSVETALIRVGDTFLPAARKLVDIATAMTNAFLKLPDPVVKAAAAIVGLTGAIAGLAGGYILLEPRITRALKVFNEIKPALLGLAGPIAAVVAGLAILGIAYDHNLGGLRDRLNGLAGDIKGAFDHVLSIVGGVRHALDQLLTIRHGNAGGVTQLVLGIASAFQRLGIGQKAAFQMALALDGIRIPIVKLINDFQSLNPVITDFVDVLLGNHSQAKLKAFGKAARYLFGRAVGKEFVDASLRLGQSLSWLFASFQRLTGVKLGPWLSVPGVFMAATKAIGAVADLIDGKFLPSIGRGLVIAIEAATNGVVFLTRNLRPIIAVFNDVMSAGRALAGVIADDIAAALTVVGDLARGDFSGAWETFKATIRNTFSGAIELGSIVVNIAGWLIGKIPDLWGWLKDHVFGTQRPEGDGTSMQTTGGVTLPQVAVNIAKWIINEGESLAKAISDKVTTLWGGIVGAAQRLEGYSIRLFKWALAEGDSLAGAVTPFVSGLWSTISGAGVTAAQTLSGYAVSLKDWIVDGDAVDLLKKAKDWITGTLTSLAVTISNYHIKVMAPDGQNIDVSVGDIFRAIWDKLTAPLVVDPGTSGKAQDLGETIGKDFTGLVIKGLKSFFSFGGGGGGGPADGEGIDQVATSFLRGLVSGMFGLGTWDAIDQQLNQQINDNIIAPFRDWFSGLGRRIIDAIGLGGGTNGLTGADSPSHGVNGGISLSSMWDGLIAALTPDLNIPIPNIPEWVTNPSRLLGPFERLATNLEHLADRLTKVWNVITGLGGKDKGSSGPDLSKGNPAGGAADASGIELTAGQQIERQKAIEAAAQQLFDHPINVKVPLTYTFTDAPNEMSQQGARGGFGSGVTAALAGAGLTNISGGAGSLSASTPPVIINVPVSYVFEPTGGSSDPLARNGSEKAPTVTATFLADDSDVAKKFTDVMTWGTIWGNSSFTGTLTANDGPTAVAFTDSMKWGDIWGGSTFESVFDGDNGPAAKAYTDAFSWGDTWAGTVFTASFDIDTSGITNAVLVAQAAAQAIADIMPHSPAKKGPLKRPITFDYIADNMRTTAKRLRTYANSSAGILADAFGATPNVAGQFAAAQLNTVAGSSGGGGTVVNQSFTALHSTEFLTLLQKAEQGSAAHVFIDNAFRPS